MIRRNCWQSVKKKSVNGDQSHLKFSKIYGGFEPHVQNIFKLCQKLRLIMLISKVDNIKKIHRAEI